MKLADPVAGTRALLVATGSSTAGEHVEVEVTYRPGSAPLPLHTHPRQSEHLTVLAGRLRVVLDGVEHEVDVGDELDVPFGAPHQMHGVATVPTTVRARTTPALRTDQLFCDLWEIASDHGFEPDVLAAFAVVQRYPDEFCLC